MNSRSERKVLGIIRDNINDPDFLRGVLGGTLDALMEDALEGSNLQTSLASLVKGMVQGSKHCGQVWYDRDQEQRRCLVKCAASGVENAMPLTDAEKIGYDQETYEKLECILGSLRGQGIDAFVNNAWEAEWGQIGVRGVRDLGRCDVPVGLTYAHGVLQLRIRGVLLMTRNAGHAGIQELAIAARKWAEMAAAARGGLKGPRPRGEREEIQEQEAGMAQAKAKEQAADGRYIMYPEGCEWVYVIIRNGRVVLLEEESMVATQVAAGAWLGDIDHEQAQPVDDADLADAVRMAVMPDFLPECVTICRISD